MHKKTVTTRLAHWYDTHQRALPWRETSDPYRIWISEIILQQTRVDQGLPYYKAFIKKFPSIQALAAAPEERIMKVWQGMGYYSRARNMKAAARMLVRHQDGVFPSDYKELMALPGIGPYTAAAIGSMAFGIPEPVLDGNVYRLLSRFYGIHDSIDGKGARDLFYTYAAALLDRDDPGRHNQAMMEFGALQCKPQNPDCGSCPLRTGCYAYREHKVAVLPVKQARRKARIRFFNYFVIRWNGQVAIQKRTGKDIWQGLYEFPLAESPDAGPVTRAHLTAAGIRTRERPILADEGFGHRHKLTHQTLHVRFVELELCARPALLNKRIRMVHTGRLNSYPLPRLITRHLEKPLA